MAATPAGFMEPTEKRPTVKLAEGIVRHAVIMPEGVRDGFVRLAKDFDVQQAQMMWALLKFGAENIAALREIARKAPTFQLYRDSPKQMKEALKKVDPEKLREFLENQGAL